MSQDTNNLNGKWSGYDKSQPKGQKEEKKADNNPFLLTTPKSHNSWKEKLKLHIPVKMEYTLTPPFSIYSALFQTLISFEYYCKGALVTLTMETRLKIILDVGLCNYFPKYALYETT